MRQAYLFITINVFCFLSFSTLHAQEAGPEEIKSLIDSYRKDPRGPYKDIRWYCKDGTVIMPKEKCPEPGGVQRARYKDEVVDLAESNHVFLGQILSTTSRHAFWDSTENNARAKQYLLEQYLKQIDNGWVNEKAVFYRGAVQVEDEVAWGQDFLRWLLARPKPYKEKFYLVRELARGIPHSSDDRLLESVRALSLLIAEDHPNFQNIRVKIHGQPDAGDIQLVKKYKAEKGQTLSSINQERLDDLLVDMEELFAPAKLEDLRKYIRYFPKSSVPYEKVDNLITYYARDKPGPGRCMELAEAIFEIRDNIDELRGSSAKLAALDLSLKLEEILFNEITAWPSKTIADQIEKNCYLSKAVAGCGYLELWEWDKVEQDLAIGSQKEMSIGDLQHVYERCRGVVEWGTNMTKAVFSDVVTTFSAFEPLALGYYDAAIRSGVLLRLGQEVGNFHQVYSKLAGIENHIPILDNSAQVRGLNPGFAKGELVVIENPDDDVVVDARKIYVFNHPPSDLKPVAGIMTVSEGNMVSHVQLLARNLAIPNAVISDGDLQDLKDYSGEQVFLAVSNQGNVILKKASDLSAEEAALFEQKVRKEERVSVPVEKLQLNRTSVINMRELDATASGIICGPKAANLAQLKKDFPDNVVEGLVIPFGIFRQHMDQAMPVARISYWRFLELTFAFAKEMEEAGASAGEVEEYVLCELEVLRAAIKEMQLKPEFVADLKASFSTVLGKDLGKIPVFLRSDTNMEDLKDFTGAGLNLTLFNVLDEEKILDGIKAVWASPYSERSFKWRQKYLLNPENVFPSILIIPSVNVDYSGVLITKGLASGVHGDLTIAFSFGAGGAVDGQAAETYQISKNGEQLLLAPARQPTYRKLPETGGTSTLFATYETPILNKYNLWDIRMLAYNAYERLAKASEDAYKGPYDIELGFLDDKLWLFQIRPFVENKSALGSDYLESISPVIQKDKLVPLYEAI
ncbi:MAG: phosphoenolpyruvate synthase [Saprospiraceae bacterium]|nr:phosphoenolpyruvate synthase [Saprospiraceae bacterium]